MTSANPIAQQRAATNFMKSLEKFSNAVGSRDQSNPYQASYAENPERFLQNPSRLPYEDIDNLEARNRNNTQFTNNLANNNQESALRRQISLQREQSALANQQSPQQKSNQDFNDYVRKANFDKSNANADFTSVNTVDNSGQLGFNRQKEMAILQKNLANQQNNNNAYNQRLAQAQQSQQQAAQNQAQERLARINQQTALYSSMFGNPGESTWRWF